MENTIETLYQNIIGPIIFFALIAFLILAFILPRTRLSRYFKISEKYFVATHIVGILCGALGLIAIFALPSDAVDEYWWKIIILPFVFMEMYLLYPMVVRRTAEIFDEKQNFNIGIAGVITLVGTIITMSFIIEPLLTSGSLELSLLNPFYLNTVVFVFSATTLILFKWA